MDDTTISSISFDDLFHTSSTSFTLNYPQTTGQYQIVSSSSLNTGLHVSSDAVFDGDIKWKGRSLGQFLEDIEKRLAILVPDPAKLEQFEALKKAYEHYKMLEALCELPIKKED